MNSKNQSLNGENADPNHSGIEEFKKNIKFKFKTNTNFLWFCL